MKLSLTEEKYLKAIYKTLEKEGGNASTNSIAEIVNTSPASVSDMIKKLTDKGLLVYEKYNGVHFSKKGRAISTELIRKHRLWETFLTKNLDFHWDQVHQIADQLDHVHSEELINRLDALLSYPKFDPHGEPIPNKNGSITIRHQTSINNLKINENGEFICVTGGDDKLFKHLTKLNLSLGSQITVLDKIEYDHSMNILINGNKKILLPASITKRLLVKKN